MEKGYCMKKILAVLIVIFVGAALPGFLIAQESKTGISGRWTGLQQDGKQFKRITLQIEAPGETSGSAWPLSGSITFEPALVGMRNAAAPQTVSLKGTVYPRINLVKFQYTHRRGGRTVYLVWLAEKNRLAMVYGDRAAKNTLPIYLSPGSKLPEVLAPFATSRVEADQFREEAERHSKQLAAIRARSAAIQSQLREVRGQYRQARLAKNQQAVAELQNQMAELNQTLVKQNKAVQEIMLAQVRKRQEQQLQQLQQENPVLADLNRKLVDLQNQMRQASKNRDLETTKRLGQQVRDLNQQRIAALQNRNTRPLSSGVNAAGSCPELLLSWSEELENNGASAASFSSMVQLANLFRPSVIIPHFKTSLLDMDPQKRGTMAFDLQRNCTKANTAFARGGNIQTVAAALRNDGHQINYVSATIAGESLDLVHKWLDYLLADPTVTGSLTDMNDLKEQGRFLMAALWPSEIKLADDAITVAYSKAVQSDLMAQIDILATRADSLDSLISFGRMGDDEKWKILTNSDRQKLTGYFNKKADSAVSRHLRNTFPEVANDMVHPRKALIAGKQWYQENEQLFALFPETDVLRQFTQMFCSRRDTLFRKITADLRKDLVGLQQKSEVNGFASELVLPMDSPNSSAWREIAALKKEQIAVLEQKAYIARVGDGPFQPDHPGAVYLNGLYRNDRKTLTEEDRQFAIPLVRMMQPVQDSGIYDLMAVFSGGAVKGNDLKKYMKTEMENASMSSSMAGFLVIALEYISPQCLGPNPVEIERTERWDQVFQNGYGMELYRISHEQSYHYTIARRHRQVFRKIGEPASAESLDLINGLFGQLGMIKKDVRSSIEKLSDNLRGLKLAMQEYPCDGEVMKRIETALISRALE